jgi:hypothetical protein
MEMVIWMVVIVVTKTEISMVETRVTWMEMLMEETTEMIMVI